MLSSKTVLQIWWRNQKLSRQAKVEGIQHHHTSFTTNATGTSLGMKQKRRKRPTQNKPKIIKKTLIESYLLIITLNLNGLSAPTKDIDWLGGWKPLRICASSYHVTLFDLSIICNYFILLLISLFQRVGSLHQFGKILELQHQSFQWIFRVDFL